MRSFVLVVTIIVSVLSFVSAQVQICPPGGGTVHELVVYAQVAQISSASPNAVIPITNNTAIIGGPSNQELLVQWDVTGLGGVPTFAIISAFVDFPIATSSPDTSSNPCDASVYVLYSLGAFDPSTVTFSNRPATNNTIVGGNCNAGLPNATQSLTSFTIDLDVTSALISSLNDFYSVFGLTLVPVNASGVEIFLPVQGINFTIIYCSTAPYLSCNGVGANVTGVCSGNGQCIAQDVCQCNNNYTGSNCQHLPQGQCGVEADLESATYDSASNTTQLCYNFTAGTGTFFSGVCNVTTVLFALGSRGALVGCYVASDIVDNGNDCWFPWTNGGPETGAITGAIYECTIPAGMTISSCITLYGPVQLGFGGGVTRITDFLGPGFNAVSPTCPRPAENHLGSTTSA